MIVSLEVVSVAVGHLPRSFHVGLVPVGLDPRSIREGNHSKPILFAVYEAANIHCAVIIDILALTILLTLAPHSVIDVPIGVGHLPSSALHVVSPLSLIDIAVGVAVTSVTLLTVFHETFKAFTVAKDVVALGEIVVLPGAKVNITVGVKIYPYPVPLVAAAQLPIVHATIVILLLGCCWPRLHLAYELLQLTPDGWVTPRLMQQLLLRDHYFHTSAIINGLLPGEVVLRGEIARSISSCL